MRIFLQLALTTMIAIFSRSTPTTTPAQRSRAAINALPSHPIEAVPDVETAREVATILLKRRFGSETVERQMPLIVLRRERAWIIGGSVHDGVFIEISATDCKVIALGSGKCGSCDWPHNSSRLLTPEIPQMLIQPAWRPASHGRLPVPAIHDGPALPVRRGMEAISASPLMVATSYRPRKKYETDRMPNGPLRV